MYQLAPRRRLCRPSLAGPSPRAEIPDRLKAYVAQYDAGLNHEEYNSPRFSYRLLFKKKLVNKPGQADSVVEFIDPNSELGMVFKTRLKPADSGRLATT